jgi:hypothetical protein
MLIQVLRTLKAICKGLHSPSLSIVLASGLANWATSEYGKAKIKNMMPSRYHNKTHLIK